LSIIRERMAAFQEYQEIPLSKKINNGFEEIFNFLRKILYIEHGYDVCAKKYSLVDKE